MSLLQKITARLLHQCGCRFKIKQIKTTQQTLAYCSTAWKIRGAMPIVRVRRVELIK